MKQLTNDERQELEALRRYRQEHEGMAITRAFAKLDALLASSCFDPLISRRAFFVITDCLMALRQLVDDKHAS